MSYGGSSQGAVNSGQYAIMPQGLNSENYALTYVDGALTIHPTTSYESAIQNAETISSQTSSTSTTSSSKQLPTAQIPNNSSTPTTHLAKIVGCGIQLPSDAASVSCN